MLGAMLAVSLIIATASVCSRGGQQQQLRACERYLTKGCECECQRESTSTRKSQECFCRSSSIIFGGEGSSSSCIMELEECCGQLEGMEEQCMCDTINKIVQHKQKQYSGMLGEAEKLPLTCGLTQNPCAISDPSEFITVLPL